MLERGGSHFKPIKVDKVIRNGEVLELGGAALTVVETPGHTRGSVSFRLDVAEGGKTYRVMIANMGTVIPGMNLIDDAAYPAIADDFRLTFKRQRAQDIDIWVAAHASQFRLHAKYKPGDAYDPERFVDPAGYRKALDRHEKMFEQKLAEQRAAK